MSVFVRSAGVVSAAGTGLPALRAALADELWRPCLGLDRPDAPPLPVATCRDFSPREHLPPMVARRLDRPARMLAVAAREALGPLGSPLPWDRQRVGVVAGTWNAGMDALLEVLKPVFLGSPDEAPPLHFPSTVANAAASQVGILEKLGGPNLTFAEKQASGLRAVTEAARLLERGRADAVLACGVDEAQWMHAEAYERLGVLGSAGRPGLMLGEGAAVVALASEPGDRPLARLAGWGSASSPAAPCRYPPDASGLVAACRAALGRAGREVDAVVSVANGLEALAGLERDALEAVLGGTRPAAVAASDRLGDGAFAPALRLVVALEILAGTPVAWGVPAHLAALGLGPVTRRPGSVLVTALAAGGSAIAAVIASR